jgi:hypothetical protein
MFLPDVLLKTGDASAPWPYPGRMCCSYGTPLALYLLVRWGFSSQSHGCVCRKLLERETDTLRPESLRCQGHWRESLSHLCVAKAIVGRGLSYLCVAKDLGGQDFVTSAFLIELPSLFEHDTGTRTHGHTDTRSHGHTGRERKLLDHV